MRHKTAIIATLLLCAAYGARAADYDLAYYLKLVETHNRDLELARRDVDAAEQTRREALSPLLPKLGLQGGYTRNLNDINQPSAAYASGQLMDGVYPLIYESGKSDYDNTFSIAGGVSLSLFNLQALENYHQAEEGQRATATAYEYQRRVVLNAAEKLYYQTLLLGEVVKVKEAAERIARENYENIKIKFEAGAATQLDALMAEVDWKSKIPELAEARRDYSLVLVNLRSLAGIDAGEEVELTENIDKFPEPPADVSLGEALAARPDYELLIRQEKLGELAVESAMAAYLPTVAASFDADYQNMSGNSAAALIGAGNLQPFAVQLSVTVNLPVYTGGYLEAKLAAGKIDSEKNEISLAKKREDVRNELTSVRLRLDEARTRIDTAALLVAAAQKAFDQAGLSLKSGMVTQIQLSQASLNLDGSRIQYYSAVYEYLAAYFDWELASGR